MATPLHGKPHWTVLKGDFSFFKDGGLCILVTGIFYMVVSINAEIKDNFKCTLMSKELHEKLQFVQVIHCPFNELPNVKNGHFQCSSPSNVLNYGELCTLVCEEGFYPAVSEHAVCGAGKLIRNGRWSNGNFTCLAISCPINELPEVTNGNFKCPSIANVFNGETCTLVCEKGFYPAFSIQVMCDEGVSNRTGRWSDGNFTCLAINCDINELPNVTNGMFECPTLSNNFSYGEVCNLTCEEGFYSPFPDHAVCGAGTTTQEGRWSGGSFSCFECNVWNEWNGNEYKLIMTKQSWDESSRLCEKDMAQLVTIGNEKENDVIQKMVWTNTSWAYIGLSRTETGLWRWVDGTNLTYVNWGPGHPGTLYEKCAYMRTEVGTWADYYCDHPRHAVCERKQICKINRSVESVKTDSSMFQ